MKRYFVDLSACSENERKKYEQVINKAFLCQCNNQKPYYYEVMWDSSENITDFIPSELIHRQQNS